MSRVGAYARSAGLGQGGGKERRGGAGFPGSLAGSLTPGYPAGAPPRALGRWRRRGLLPGVLFRFARRLLAGRCGLRGLRLGGLALGRLCTAFGGRLGPSVALRAFGDFVLLWLGLLLGGHERAESDGRLDIAG